MNTPPSSEQHILKMGGYSGYARTVADDLHRYGRTDFELRGPVVFTDEDGVGLYRNIDSFNPDKPFHNPDVVIATTSSLTEENRSPLERSDIKYGDSDQAFANDFDMTTPKMNDGGHVAFRVPVERGDQGLFRSNGRGEVFDAMALAGNPAPGASGDFDTFRTPAINDNRQVAAMTYLRGGSITDENNKAVYRYAAPKPGQTQFLLAQAGQSSPARPGYHFTDFSGSLDLNESGEVVFSARMESDSGDQASGLYVHDGDTLREAVGTGDLLPSDSGRQFKSVVGPAEIQDQRILFDAQVEGEFF